MVLWEITLATAYFLGLKRTYRLALKIERRLVTPKHPKIRDFLHRRTRAVFDMALTVHRNIQQKDLEVGRNIGNRILRWLDRMKPSAEIRGSVPSKPPNGRDSVKHLPTPSRKSASPNQKSNLTSGGQKSDGRVFATSLNFRSKSFPTWSAMIRPLNPSNANIQYRQLNTCGPYMTGMNYWSRGFEGGVIRKDIVQWLLRK